MSGKKQKANYGALFNAGAAIQSGAFPKTENASALTDDEYMTAQYLPIDTLFDNPYQPRTSFSEESLQELASTIKDQGFQGVLIARPHPAERGCYQITAGHRRREAAKRSGLTTLPVIIKEIADQDMTILAVTENIQREDLTSLEEGKIFCLMMDQMGMTLEQVADAVKKSESYVRNRRRVAQAPEDIQRLVMQKPDSLRAVFYLQKIENVQERAHIINLLVQGQLTADQIDQYVKTRAAQKTAEENSSTNREAQATVLPETDGIADTLKASSEVQEVPHVDSPEDAEKSSPSEIEPLNKVVIIEKQRIIGVSKLKTLLKTIRIYAENTTHNTLSPEEAEIVEQIIQIAQSIQNVSRTE